MREGRCVAVAARQYYYSRTSTPIVPALLLAEDGSDSDEDLDEEWRLRVSEALLDEFEDVSPLEKTFMKLWNRWLFDHPVRADRSLPAACKAFAHAASKARDAISFF